MSAAESILTTLIGVLTAATVLTAGLWRPAKWLIRSIESHVVETVDERLALTAVGHAQITEQTARTAEHLRRLDEQLHAHQESGRHTS